MGLEGSHWKSSKSRRERERALLSGTGRKNVISIFEGGDSRTGRLACGQRRWPRSPLMATKGPTKGRPPKFEQENWFAEKEEKSVLPSM